MIDFDTLLYGPVYDILGVEATLTPNGSAGPVTLIVIDRTDGIDVSVGRDGADAFGADVQTVLPVAIARASDLESEGIAVEDLEGGTIQMNGALWRIKSHRARPNPSGDGEHWLILMEEDGS